MVLTHGHRLMCYTQLYTTSACTPESGHYRTMGITAPKGEPSSLQEAFYSEITRSLSEGAAHPALHVQNDETPTALATSTDLQEVSRTWYLAFFSKPQ